MPSAVSEDRVTLAVALAQLAPRQRAVVVLRYYEDLTERETAEVLGIAVGTVKSQHRDAIARLRTLLPGLETPSAPSDTHAAVLPRGVT